MQDQELIKERLLSNAKYQKPHYFHNIRLYQESDYMDFDYEIYPAPSDIDRNGDTSYTNQSWELSFDPSSVEILIKENTSADDVIRLLQKAIYNIRNSKDGLAVDYQQRNKLLNSIKAQAEHDADKLPV
jgi:hypothetical protein